MNFEEVNLIRRAKNGDALAFARLHDIYYPIVYRFFYYRVDDMESVETLSSDLFLRVTEELGFYKLRGIPFKDWLYTLSMDLLMERSLVPRRRSQAKKQATPTLETKASSPMDAVSLKHLLSFLHQDERELVISRLIEERSSHIAAQDINRSIRNTRLRQRLALSKLNQIIQQEGATDEA